MTLHAGPLEVRFEPDNAWLRTCRLGEVEVLRGIYGAVRDPHWRTIIPRVRLTRVETGTAGFRVEFSVDCQEAEIHFTWNGCLTGDVHGAIKYAFLGEAQSSFWHNRIGLCVLHPVRECAGHSAWMETVDGNLESGAFPFYISPFQPFKNIRAITHQVRDGLRATVRLAGEVFEMEDQRNWTDASFKTYCPPLARPYPAFIPAGTRLHQEIELTFQGSWPERVEIEKTSPRLILELPRQPVRSKPPIGLCLSSPGEPLTVREIDRLRRLALSHLRVDLRLGLAGWAADLHRAAREAARLNVSLHLALFLDGQAEAELAGLRHELAQLMPPISMGLVFPPDPASPSEPWTRRVKNLLAEYAPAAAVASGSSANFAELNRNRPRAQSEVLPCFPINPQVHAFDNTTLVENLEAQVEAVNTARQFSPQPVVVSPVTLRPRPRCPRNSQETSPGPVDLKALADPRQLSLLGAGWTLGSLARLAPHLGIHSLTYYETTGCRGVMEREAGCPWPHQFPSIPGAVFPLYHVLADLADVAQVAPIEIRGVPRLTGLMAWDACAQPRLLLANLGEDPLQISLRSVCAAARIRPLDETNALQAMTAPEVYRAEASRLMTAVEGWLHFDLPAFGLTRIDFTGAP